MDLTVGNQGGTNNVLRDYRKGNWNLQETLILIEAKKMDDERRMKRLGDTGERAKPAELRWKWVEDYCWKNGCFRSQNQCNDKWDNLMRDFKKVREYERREAERGAAAGDDHKSYWRMEKAERKDKNLPSNMLPQIYEALVEVVERKAPRTATPVVASGGAGSSNLRVNVPTVEISMTPFLGHHSMPSPIQQYPTIPLPLPQPPPQHTAAEPPTNLPSSNPLPTSDSETSGYSDSPAKRRKRRGGGGGGEGTSGGGTLQEVGSAISKSASTIAGAIQTCEEREERRHRELVNLHERRLQIEESKAEINRQGINGLVEAINKLANSIFALASHTATHSTSK